jgi:L-fuculose-phosphate aldolase
MTALAGSKWEKEREALYKVCHKLAASGQAVGSSGNASMRLQVPTGDLVLITPMGRALEELSPLDLAVVDMDGEPVEEDLPPSSETALHLAVYRRRPDVGGVVHVHAVFSSVAAVAGWEIPPIIDEVVIKLGGGVRVAEYAFPGTEDLAQEACSALGDRMAVLLRHHGLLAAGLSVQEALDNSLLVERLAQIYLYTSMAKEARPLPAEVIKIEEELYRMRRSAAQAKGGNHGFGT